MNDSRDPRTRMLAETLAGDWVTGPTAEMARRAAAHARRRRELRRSALVLTTVAVLGAAFLWSHRVRPTPAVPFVHAAPHGYEIISDDEFVALLRDRPLLVLPQENGANKFVVLER